LPLFFDRLGVRGRRVGAYGSPHFVIDPNSGTVMSKVLAMLGVEVLDAPPEGADVNIWHCFPHRPKPSVPNLINGRFMDFSKSGIDVAHRAVFGRGVCMKPDEIDPDTPYVVKSEEQAAHDGRILLGRVLVPYDWGKGRVVQRLIDNTTGDGEVMDIRAPVIGGDIPFVYLKTRRIDDRFSNANSMASMTRAENVLSAEEIGQVKQFCAVQHLDYGELDILRDNKDGLIWIVDVNSTPCGPPNGISKGESDLAVREIAFAFAARFFRTEAV
jgi:hypothetical protein